MAKVTPPKIGNTYRVDNPSTTLQTLIAPASNTKGVILYSAYCRSYGGTGRLMAKASAPTAWNDATAQTLGVARSTPGLGPEGACMFENARAVPPGLGVYYQMSLNTDAQDYIDVNAEIL